MEFVTDEMTLRINNHTNIQDIKMIRKSNTLNLNDMDLKVPPQAQYIDTKNHETLDTIVNMSYNIMHSIKRPIATNDGDPIKDINLECEVFALDILFNRLP